MFAKSKRNRSWVVEMPKCKKHNLPKIWGRRGGDGIYKYCTLCLEEEWEKEFKEVREEWSKLTSDEILVWIGVFYEYMTNRGLSEAYAKDVNYYMRRILRELRERELRANDENVEKVLENFSSVKRPIHRRAWKLFKEFKEGLAMYCSESAEIYSRGRIKK